MAHKVQIPFGRAFALFGLAAVLVLPAAPAIAEAKTFTTTSTGTHSESTSNPCTGDPGTFTIAYTGVFHITQNAAGGVRTTPCGTDRPVPIGVPPSIHRRGQAVRATAGMPSCVANQATRPVRNQEAPAPSRS